MSSTENTILFFYQNNNLTTLQSKEHKRTLFQTINQPCAELKTPNNCDSILLATDYANSVLKSENSSFSEHHIYTIYGFSASQPSHLTSIGFNGDHIDRAARIILLGKGYRGYDTNIFRFLSPDSFSPFDNGGINSYSYCSGDPINRSDPTGHSWIERLLKPVKAGQKNHLKNHYPKLLKEELKLIKNHNKQNKEPRHLITTATDLTKTGTNINIKFVIDKNNQMAASISGDKGLNSYVSHPAIARKLPSRKIISAGTIIIGSLGDAIIINQSGHYQPTLEDLSPAVAKLREFGFDPIIQPYK